MEEVLHSTPGMISVYSEKMMNCSLSTVYFGRFLCHV